MDLFAEFKVLDYGKRLGWYISHYRDKYFLPDKRSSLQVFTYKLKPGAEQQIYQAISDITISMKTEDYLEMPPCIHNEVKVRLSDRERAIYESFKRQMVVSLGGEEIDAVNAAALTNKLLQMANGSVYDSDHNEHHIHDRKLDALEDLIEGANGKPVLVAYWFKHDLVRIRERFDVRELKTSGDISDWNAGKIPVAVIHPASAGHGLNLQYGGCTLVWFGLTWSLELYQQTNKRLHRQGQKDTVIIHHILTEDTMDEQVMGALQRKDQTQAALIDAVKAVLEA
jgi:SNF2 family DNA or RNA helicase